MWRILAWVTKALISKMTAFSSFGVLTYQKRTLRAPHFLRPCPLAYELLSICIACLGACASKNLGDETRELTPEQEAKELMNAGDYEGAIELLEPLVEDEPSEHFRRPLLSAAYAASAGIKVFDIVESQIGGSDDSSDSAFEMVDTFLPDDYDRDDVDVMDQSVTTLDTIPRKLRGKEGDPDYGASADFQLTLYRSLYSTMYLYLFFPGGKVDLDNLDDLTLDDVEAILSTLAAAAAEGDTEQSEAIAEAIGGTLDDIDGAEGEDDREKLINYFQNQ